MEKIVEKKIKLIALDLDGTFLDEEKRISEENSRAVREAIKNGIVLAVSTGRAFGSIPLKELEELGISYAITANGAMIHKLPEQECLYSDGMDSEFACEIINELQDLDVQVDAFVEGRCYGEKRLYDRIDQMDLSDVMKNYMRNSRTFVDSETNFIRENNAKVQKLTLNFFPDQNGTCRSYDVVYERFVNDPRINIVTGGYNNLELNNWGVTKGNSLRFLSEKLGIPLENTMACGDTQNDLDMIRTAGIGVAMGNATDDVKQAADFITRSNEEDGVAYAIRTLALQR